MMSQEEMVDWYWALLEGCLDEEQYTQEELDDLVEQGYADFMAEWAYDIQDQFTDETREQTHASYFYANESLEETVDWYFSLCKHTIYYNTCSDEEAKEMMASGELVFYFLWADSIYATLPKDTQESLLVEVSVDKNGNVEMLENPLEQDDYLGPEMN